MAQRLLRAMGTRLDAERSGQVRNELSEKAKGAEYAFWKLLGFHGIPGSKFLTREWPSAFVA